MKNGKREEAQYNAISHTIGATGKLWQITLFAFFVEFIFGYNALFGTTNTDLAKFGLLFYLSIIPLVICVITGLLFWKLYTIGKDEAISNKEKLIESGL